MMYNRQLRQRTAHRTAELHVEIWHVRQHVTVVADVLRAVKSSCESRASTSYRMWPPMFSLHMLHFAHRNSFGSQVQRIGHDCRFGGACVPCPILACSCLGRYPFRQSQANTRDINRAVSPGGCEVREVERRSKSMLVVLYNSGLT